MLVKACSIHWGYLEMKSYEANPARRMGFVPGHRG
jgi:hypothetical protein